jgi:hypothetical protein
MLQALEVMNGATLANVLRRGAKRMLGELPPSPENLFDSGVRGQGGPGIAPFAPVDIDISQSKRLILLVEDVDSYDPGRVVAGWAEAELTGPNGAERIAGTRATLAFKGREPMEGITMKVGSQAVYDIAGKGFTRFHAVAGVDERHATSDIQPKVRFFVFDEEPDRQRLVRVAGDPPMPFAPWRYAPDQLAARLFEYAMARAPSPKELAVARRMASSSDGLEDLLWSVFLLPEFQYVR